MSAFGGKADVARTCHPENCSLLLTPRIAPFCAPRGVLANATDSFTKSMLAQIELSAQTVNVEIQPIFLRPGEQFDKAFEESRAKQVDAVFIQPSLLRKDAVDLANAHRLPLFSFTRFVGRRRRISRIRSEFHRPISGGCRLRSQDSARCQPGEPASLPAD